MNDSIFEEEAIEKSIEKFILVVEDLIKGSGWNWEEVGISKTSLTGAFQEVRKDMEIILLRRSPKNGISPSKIAGVVTFCLTKRNPLHLSNSLLEEQEALKINFLAAFAFSLKYILNINLTNFPSSVTQEFQYTLARRHTNQETLGLAYDMLQFYCQEKEDSNL